MIKREYDLAISTPNIKGVFNIMDINLSSGILPDQDVEVHISDCGWFVCVLYLVPLAMQSTTYLKESHEMEDEHAHTQACQMKIDRDLDAKGDPERETREEYILLPFEVERDFTRDPEVLNVINSRNWDMYDPPGNNDDLIARELNQTVILQLVVKKIEKRRPREHRIINAKTVGRRTSGGGPSPTSSAGGCI